MNESVGVHLRSFFFFKYYLCSSGTACRSVALQSAPVGHRQVAGVLFIIKLVSAQKALLSSSYFPLLLPAFFFVVCITVYFISLFPSFSGATSDVCIKVSRVMSPPPHPDLALESCVPQQGKDYSSLCCLSVVYSYFLPIIRYLTLYAPCIILQYIYTRVGYKVVATLL
jgi:hypothetical protein